MINKKAQHEMVGFVLIIVIVVIIGLILLVFYLKQPSIETKSLNVQNFLQASMSYTTSCYLSIEPLDLQELIKSCYKNERCSNEEMACEVLNKTLSELVHESWLVSSEKPENAYVMDIYHAEDEEVEYEKKEVVKDEILSLQEGNCTGSKTGAEHFFKYERGNIFVTMELCYT